MSKISPATFKLRSVNIRNIRLDDVVHFLFRRLSSWLVPNFGQRLGQTSIALGIHDKRFLQQLSKIDGLEARQVVWLVQPYWHESLHLFREVSSPGKQTLRCLM
jgi:hypothetical protein